MSVSAGGGRRGVLRGFEPGKMESEIFWEAAADILLRGPEAYGRGGFLLRLWIFYHACGFFIRRAEAIGSVSGREPQTDGRQGGRQRWMSFYACGYFIKGADNFLLDSM